MKLYIGNKNYSSWSFRVWLTLKTKNIPFEEVLRPFDVENDYADFFEFSPTGKVPVLIDEGQTLWESLAILDCLAEKYPQADLWPKELEARTRARCVAHEMHAGFMALRAACPMNMRRRIEPIRLDKAVQRDIGRVETIWAECLETYGGPFLFGENFTIADGMFAPIVNRLQIYELSATRAVRRYTETLTSLDAWKEWSTAAHAEEWVLDIDEIYA